MIKELQNTKWINMTDVCVTLCFFVDYCNPDIDKVG